LGQYYNTINEQQHLESERGNGNIGRTFSGQYLKQNNEKQINQDVIDLDKIQPNIVTKKYAKSVPENSTMDILQFKLYQQELEKKKKDKSVYSNVYNHYSYSVDGGSRYESKNLYTEPHGIDYNGDHETDYNQDQEQQFSKYDVNSSDYNQSSNTITMKDTEYNQSSRTVTVKDSDSGQPSLTVTSNDSEQGQTQQNQEPLNTNITATSTTEPKVGSYKPPLYSISTKVNNNNSKRNLTINTSKLSNNSKIRVNTSLKLSQLSQPINSANTNSEIFYTPIDNDNEEHYNDGNRLTNNNDNNLIISKDISFKTSLSNDDSSSESSLNSPSGILYSPNGSKAFKDMSSLSIIVPKNIDNSMVLENHQDQYQSSTAQDHLQSILSPITPISSVSMMTPLTLLTPLTPLKPLHEMDYAKSLPNIANNTMSTFSNNITPNQSFIDLSINDSIANVIENPEVNDEDYSVNYSHSINNRKRSTEPSSSKRRSKNFGSPSDVIVPTTLFTSSLPPISRPTRVQSLPKVKTNSSGVNGKKTMAKAQDYIALSQRSFPVRANFIPDIYYDDEIKLNTGDLVVITDVYLDSWARGNYYLYISR